MFANLSKLIYIDLSDNAQLEVETEYPHTVPTFQLQSLLLNNCILNKHSGGGIPTFISTQRRIETLDASYSFLRGTIPSWLLYNATVSSLNLRGNSLQCPFPQSTRHNKSMLGKLDISDNKIYGALPSNMETLFPSLVLFNMSHNELKGTIPSSIKKLQMLTIMDLSVNNLSGEMPHGLISNNTSLKYLKLSNNKLQGNILSKFSNMTELAVLLLDNNGFTGTIASDMLSSPSLKIIDLRKNNLLGHIPSWFPDLTNLGILLLGGNFFNGPIPLELCLMQNLHILDLSNNAISGSIPSCFNNISSWMTETPNNIDWSLGSQSGLPILNVVKFPVDELYTRITTNLTTKGTTLTYGGLPLALITGIDLSMNQLVGNIPSQVGHLKELHFLKLSNNILSGPIPESFQNLKNIESLDLSHNKLVGTIPPQMIELYSLSTFNVSFNSLSGMIPYEKQFHTFDERSYMGNPDLCGSPLQRNCYNPSQPDQDMKGEEERSAILDSPIFFYLWVTSSYALGFWGFIALLTNKSRRRKIFRIVDCCFICM
ncbi:LRR receptor-like serine/threonine-protein kinase ERECTA [Cinnamomum micranthum f. kanehirae]|uniref:LRR receptor-like serine/threonine-protein kinase ERECTA n=1 Tax=Cinnamomum micranthum f. kanehirae TaxID=337451 RepID=A0A3S3LZ90_9MAGN|nr:LRR receptor-like serine/threonine-protein kinase ERECTA [Cinnamomum micranthum f. kanehirae]